MILTETLFGTSWINLWVCGFLLCCFRSGVVTFQKWRLALSLLHYFLRNSVEFVLSHPNGWGLLQQSILSTALAATVPSANLGPAEVVNRVHFVSEAEAAVHFALHFSAAATSDSWLVVSRLFYCLLLGLMLIFIYV